MINTLIEMKKTKNSYQSWFRSISNLGLLVIFLTCMSCNGQTTVNKINEKIHDEITSSEPYKTSMKKANENKAVQEELGLPIKSDLSLLSLDKISLQEKEDYGKTNMHIPLIGSNGMADLHVIGSKKNGKWIYSKMLVSVKKSDIKIDLLSN